MTTTVRIAILCSGNMSAAIGMREQDPNYGTTYEFVGVFSDAPDCGGLAYAKQHGIPHAAIDFELWRKRANVAKSDLTARQLYYEEVLDCIKPWRADAIVCSGFMLKITNPLLLAFPGRMTNVHPALFHIRSHDGTPKYKGKHAVSAAMVAGDPTGSTVHIVHPDVNEVDSGPVVFESRPLQYKKGDDPKVHQERMKWACDVPAYITAMDLLITRGWPEKRWRPS